MDVENLRKLAHELALEYVRKTFKPEKHCSTEAIVDAYLDAYKAILDELEKVGNLYLQ